MIELDIGLDLDHRLHCPTENVEHLPMWRDILDRTTNDTTTEGTTIVRCAHNLRSSHKPFRVTDTGYTGYESIGPVRQDSRRSSDERLVGSRANYETISRLLCNKRLLERSDQGVNRV